MGVQCNWRLRELPAKSAGLLPLSRLRTVREGFPSYGSSISSRFRAALHENYLAMFMDVGHVLNLVFAAHGLRDFIEDILFVAVANVHGKTTVIAAPFLVFPYLFELSG